MADDHEPKIRLPPPLSDTWFFNFYGFPERTFAAQVKMLEFIQDFKVAHNGHSPHLGHLVAGPLRGEVPRSSAQYYLKKLAEKGKVVVHRGETSWLELPGERYTLPPVITGEAETYTFHELAGILQEIADLLLLARPSDHPFTRHGRYLARTPSNLPGMLRKLLDDLNSERE